MYEHAIPQNIMDYEFKLFAGLTLKQFIYVAVAGGFSFLLFQLNRAGIFPSFFAWLTIPPILLVGITLGLGSYNRRTMEDWLTSFARANNIVLRRVWKKDASLVDYEHFHSTRPQKLPHYLAIYLMTHDEYKKALQDPSSVTTTPQPLNVTTIQDIPAPQLPTVISLTPTAAVDYAEPGVSLPAIPNTIAFKLSEDALPLEGVVAYCKDTTQTVVSALRSNKDGIIYFNQSFANGNYEIEFQSPEAATFPKVKIEFSGTTYPLINLSPTS
ncbi:MAG: PrgI family protein [Candidatus Dojkabacteria bacterium]|nr:MAG: PrgI family protein [Candidatus Dojkabacteria bacterium]